MKKNIIEHIFNGKRVFFQDNGDSANITQRDGTIVASFPDHLDAEAFFSNCQEVVALQPPDDVIRCVHTEHCLIHVNIAKDET